MNLIRRLAFILALASTAAGASAVVRPLPFVLEAATFPQIETASVWDFGGWGVLVDGSEPFGLLDELKYSYGGGNRVAKIARSGEGLDYYGRPGFASVESAQYTWNKAGALTADLTLHHRSIFMYLALLREEDIFHMIEIHSPEKSFEYDKTIRFTFFNSYISFPIFS